MTEISSAPPPPPPPPLSWQTSSASAPTGALCYPGFAQCLFVVPTLLANTVWPSPLSPPPPVLIGQEVQLEPKPKAQCARGMRQLFDGVPCSSDSQCQALATGFFCFSAHCCAMENPPPSGYGAACSLQEHCKFPNSDCRANICYCRPGYNFNGQVCILQGAAQYDPRPNAGCASGQVLINGRCYGYSGYGGSCDYTRQCNYPGGLCYQHRCVCPPGQLYNNQRCAEDPNIPNVGCPPNQIRIGDQCLPLVGFGGHCVHDLQCRTKPGEQLLYCASGGMCRYTATQWDPTPEQRAFPICRNPAAEVELYNGIPKDCIYQKCAPGYHCEWNALYKGGQYICCGAGRENPFYGQPKMYPGYSNLPLKCTALNGCQFVDFPYCVDSESYRHKVCCSRPQCL